MARFQAHSLRLHTNDLNSGNEIKIGGLISASLNTGTESASDDSGAIYDEVRSIVSQVPQFDLTFKTVRTILQYISLGGYCIASDGTHLGAQLFGAILNDCKSPPGATDNLRYTSGKGLIVLGSINAPRGADATITITIHPITDGDGNAPIAGLYTGVTLPTGVITEQHVLGRCKVGNITLSDMADMQLDFGVQISAKTPEMGSVWPDSVAVRAVQPVALFTNFDPRILADASIPLAGKRATHAQTIIQLKKRANYSTFVANGTAEHIRLTMDGLATITSAFEGSGQGEASLALRVEGVHDGTNVPVVVNVASTYTDAP